MLLLRPRPRPRRRALGPARPARAPARGPASPAADGVTPKYKTTRPCPGNSKPKPTGFSPRGLGAKQRLDRNPKPPPASAAPRAPAARPAHRGGAAPAPRRALLSLCSGRARPAPGAGARARTCDAPGRPSAVPARRARGLFRAPSPLSAPSICRRPPVPPPLLASDPHRKPAPRRAPRAPASPASSPAPAGRPPPPPHARRGRPPRSGPSHGAGRDANQDCPCARARLGARAGVLALSTAPRCPHAGTTPTILAPRAPASRANTPAHGARPPQPPAPPPARARRRRRRQAAPRVRRVRRAAACPRDAPSSLCPMLPRRGPAARPSPGPPTIWRGALGLTRVPLASLPLQNRFLPTNYMLI